MDIAKENHNFALAELLLASFLLHFSSERGSNGGIGRHEGLKIPCPGRGVRVQVPLRVQRNLEKPHNLGTSKGSFFVFLDPSYCLLFFIRHLLLVLAQNSLAIMFLFNNAIYLLPYSGVGSGITRALDEDINVTFMNNDKAQEFVITVWRGKSNQVEVESNQVSNEVRRKSNQVEDESNQVSNDVHGKSNQVEDHDTGLRHSDTGLRHSDTDLDTNLDTLTLTMTLKECH